MSMQDVVNEGTTSPPTPKYLTRDYLTRDYRFQLLFLPIDVGFVVSQFGSLPLFTLILFYPYTHAAFQLGYDRPCLDLKEYKILEPENDMICEIEDTGYIVGAHVDLQHVASNDMIRTCQIHNQPAFVTTSIDSDDLGLPDERVSIPISTIPFESVYTLYIDMYRRQQSVLYTPRMNTPTESARCEKTNPNYVDTVLYITDSGVIYYVNDESIYFLRRGTFYILEKDSPTNSNSICKSLSVDDYRNSKTVSSSSDSDDSQSEDGESDVYSDSSANPNSNDDDETTTFRENEVWVWVPSTDNLQPILDEETKDFDVNDTIESETDILNMLLDVQNNLDSVLQRGIEPPVFAGICGGVQPEQYLDVLLSYTVILSGTPKN